jgi:hypothetical protein
MITNINFRGADELGAFGASPDEVETVRGMPGYEAGELMVLVPTSGLAPYEYELIRLAESSQIDN